MIQLLLYGARQFGITLIAAGPFRLPLPLKSQGRRAFRETESSGYPLQCIV